MGFTREIPVIETIETVNGKDFIRYTHKETGEVLDQFWDERKRGRPGRKPKGRDFEFFRLYRTNWLDIIRKHKLTVHEGGFLMFMLGFIKWESTFLVHPDTGELLTVSSLADLLGLDRSNVSEMLDRLNRKGFIIICKKGDGRANNFMFNTNVAFFGKYLKDLTEHDAFKMKEYQPAARLEYKEPPPKDYGGA